MKKKKEVEKKMLLDYFTTQELRSFVWQDYQACYLPITFNVDDIAQEVAIILSKKTEDVVEKIKPLVESGKKKTEDVDKEKTIFEKKKKAIENYARGTVRKVIQRIIKKDKKTLESKLGNLEDIRSGSSEYERVWDENGAFYADRDKNKEKEIVNKIFFETHGANIVNESLEDLSPVSQGILIDSYYKDAKPREIAQERNLNAKFVREKKIKTAKMFKNILLKKFKKLSLDEETVLQDISIVQDILKYESMVGVPMDYNNLIANNPEANTHKETKEDREYIDMLLHTIEDFAGLKPIEEMMDDYLFGRLTEEHKFLLERHLLNCDNCLKEFRERRFAIGALRSVLRDQDKLK